MMVKRSWRAVAGRGRKVRGLPQNGGRLGLFTGCHGVNADEPGERGGNARRRMEDAGQAEWLAPGRSGAAGKLGVGGAGQAVRGSQVTASASSVKEFVAEREWVEMSLKREVKVWHSQPRWNGESREPGRLLRSPGRPADVRPQVCQGASWLSWRFLHSLGVGVEKVACYKALGRGAG